MNSLGKTTEEIAQSLQKKRIKGVKNDHENCVLAAFLKKYFSIGKGCNKNCIVSVGAGQCKITRIYETKGEKSYSHTNSPAQEGIIDAFDQGGIPELEEKK